MDRDPLAILLSSAASTFFSTALTNPIEVYKLNQQFLPVACPAYPNKCTQPPSSHSHPLYGESHKSFIEECICRTNTLKRSLFSGLSVVLPQFMFANIFFMQLYEYQKKTFASTNWGKQHSELSTVLAAMTSRAVVSSVTVPMEAKRVRLSNHITNVKMSSLSLRENASSIKVTLARDLLFSMLYWSIIQKMRNIMSGTMEYREKKQKTRAEILIDNALPGMIGGGIVSLLTCPLDTVKTRVQTQSLVVNSITGQMARIYEKQGIRGLFLGYKFRVLKSLVHSSLYLVFYQQFLNMATSRLQKY